MKKSAILIVNGFDRHNRWGTYTPQQASAHPWIDICLRQVQRHSRGSSYDVLVYDNACLPQHRRIMARFPQVKVRPGLTGFLLSLALESLSLGRFGRRLLDLGHPGALDFLVDRLGDAYEYFITLDTDAFPVQDGWIEFLTATVERGCALVGVYRDEMSPVLTPFVHVSCLCMRVHDFRQLPVSFSRAQMKDVGQNISVALYRRAARVGCLDRTNRVNHHFLIAGVYGNLIYHHGAGSRHARFWALKEAPREAREQEERLKLDLQGRLFGDLDRFIEGLLSARYGRLPSPTVRVLEAGAYPALTQPGRSQRRMR